MGSFQQISLGVVCLVAAFMFGNYVNNHPDPANVTTAFEKNDLAANAADSLASVPNQAVQRAAPIEELQIPSASRLPTMKLPNLFGRSNPRTSPTKLPPPSELDEEASPKALTPPAKMPNLLESRKRREIMVPDFSQLAAEFRNTPLELPPMQRLIGNRNTVPSRQPTTEQHREWNPFADNPNLSAPFDSPQFTADDFTPKLKERINSNSDSQLQINGSSTMPPLMEPQETASKIPEVVPPQSYVADDEPRFSDQQNDQRTAQMNPITEGVSPPPGNQHGWLNRDHQLEKISPPTHQTAKPMIPFGLTPEAKSKLVRLQRPVQKQVDVGASRYEEHLTRPGDSLQELSKRFYGRPDFYLDIYLANQNQLRNPASVPAGITLKIPIFE